MEHRDIGHASTSAAEPLRTAFRHFPSAAQPDLVRSAQKDELYLQQFTEACYDVVRQLLGPRRALQYARETGVLAQLLYYGCTTGCGMQTLGEEYCDIVQVTGNGTAPVGALRRGSLVLLQSLAPYVVERLAGGGRRRGHALGAHPYDGAMPAFSDDDDGNTGIDDGGGGSGWFAATPPVASAAAPPGGGEIQPAHDGPRGSGAALAARWPALRDAGLGWARRGARALLARRNALLRLHLALFYLFGAFYAWPYRLSRVRYAFIGRLYERRPHYSVLGGLLLLQLAVSGGLWAAERVAPAGVSALLCGAPGGGGGAPPKAVVLKEDADEAEDEGAAACCSSAAADAPTRRCPLCLSARTAPAATPCGHVFCWQCVAEWVGQKPECPLCRSPVALQELVCVYHADF